MPDILDLIKERAVPVEDKQLELSSGDHAEHLPSVFIGAEADHDQGLTTNYGPPMSQTGCKWRLAKYVVSISLS